MAIAPKPESHTVRRGDFTYRTTYRKWTAKDGSVRWHRCTQTWRRKKGVEWKARKQACDDAKRARAEVRKARAEAKMQKKLDTLASRIRKLPEHAKAQLASIIQPLA